MLDATASIREPTPPSIGIPADPGIKPKVCLVIVFNHRYEANLPKLDWVYRGRFEHIRYLVPFYQGDRADVYPVYYSPYQFQGFFMTAWQRLREEGFTHFVFSADDLVINPRLNQDNICEQLGIGMDAGYTKQITSLTESLLSFFAFPSTLVAVAGSNGVNWEKELPDYEAARANLAAKGAPVGRLGWHNWRAGIRAKGFFQILFYLILRLLRRRKDPSTDLLALPYPLLYSLVDFIVVPAAAMEKFTFYCSVFASMSVFVEMAVPTALVLSCPRVVSQNQTAWKVIDNWYGDVAKWNAYCRQYDYRLERLLAEFEEGLLYTHPVKFSQWTYPN